MGVAPSIWHSELGIVWATQMFSSAQHLFTSAYGGFDTSYLVPALQRLGPRFVGVVQLPPSVSATW